MPPSKTSYQIGGHNIAGNGAALDQSFIPAGDTASFDEVSATVAGCADQFGLARGDSLDVVNDPRFFAKNVMDKRLGAFKSMTVVSSLMFGTALGQSFHLKKNMNFSKFDIYVFNIAIWQIIGFFLSTTVVVMCLVALYVIAHQLFYTYRLMTAGPTGFEQACMFYLTKTIVMWRHLAMRSLFSGLMLFMVVVGIQLFVLFYKDAEKDVKKIPVVWMVNLANGTSYNHSTIDLSKLKGHHKLNMGLHAALGYVCLAFFSAAACLLLVIRRHHVTVFQQNYNVAMNITAPIDDTFKTMSRRGSSTIRSMQAKGFLDT